MLALASTTSAFYRATSETLFLPHCSVTMILQLSTRTAVSSCLFLASSFVGVLYLVPQRIRKLPRNDPDHIKARFCGVAGVCVGSVLFLNLFRAEAAGSPPLSRWLGITAESLMTAAYLPLILTASLFVGPMVQESFDFVDMCKRVERQIRAEKGGNTQQVGMP